MEKGSRKWKERQLFCKVWSVGKKEVRYNKKIDRRAAVNKNNSGREEK